jgi:hypothetical protein
VSRGDGLARLSQALEDHGCAVRGNRAQCPAHEDRAPSLSIGQGRDGAVLKCQAECETGAVLEALGMSAADLFDEPHGEHGADDWTPAGPAVATYLYTDAAGKVLFGVCRTADKRFSQWRPDPSKRHGRAWSVKGVKLVPYRLPRVLAAVDAGETVYIPEGEKDVHALEAAGVTATCNPMGAGKWRAAYSRHLAGAQVVIIADRDERGTAHARDVAVKLDGIAASVTIVTAAEGKDASDHLAAGRGVGDFVPLAAGGNFPSAHPSAARAHLHTPPALASDQDILRRAVRVLRVCRGLVGENKAAKLIYLALTSRLLAEPVSAVIKGLSSSGKSYTIECVAALFPAEAVYAMTAMSERALIYLDEPLAHRTLILYEAAALREGREKAEDNQTAYIVRSLLSEDCIKYPVVTKDPDSGRFRTETKVIPGPTNLVTSTTSVSLHGENETRMLSVPSNDSKAQTKAVMVQSAGERKRAGADLTEWHDLQRWLAGQETAEVVIPYAACVAGQIPPVAVRLRRDWNAVRSLIRAHAMLHQLNRKRDERGRIIADTDDYTAVRSLVNDLIADAVGATVPASVQETVDVVGELEATRDYATVHDVASLLKIERPSAQRRLATARDSGYIVNTEDKRGKPARYVTGDPLPSEVVVLPPAKDICTPAHPCTHTGQGETAGQECDCTGVCRCAVDTEG